MNLPTTIETVADLLAALASEHESITVDKIEVTPWGVRAGFSMDGVSIDTSDVISGATVDTIHVGEEDFVTTDVVRFDLEACTDEEEESPAMIVVGTHSSGESSDEDFCASLYGEAFLLADGGDVDAWREAATREHGDLMSKCVMTAIEALVKMMADTSDRALKGIAGQAPVKDLMRRLAAST